MNEQGEPDGAEQQMAEEQLQWRLEEALREALTRGVSMESMHWLAYGCGIPLARVTGEPPTGEQT